MFRCWSWAKRIDEVLLVFKSYVTRVGQGPLKNEIDNDELESVGGLSTEA